MKFGLETMSVLCARLGHPERAFAPVLIGGTNGKGSVAAMVHRGLVAAGHRAGRYTSPHLERLEERFVVHEREVATAELRGALETVRQAAESLQASGALTAPPTFFECTTAAAFELFRRAGVSIAVLEVGLGGRLDATNVAAPVAAAVTSIDFDHEAQLGTTLEAIAREKAGIIRPGIPVVCGRMAEAAERVLRDACADLGARFIRAAGRVPLDVATGGRAPALAGAHQQRNAEVAACLLRELDGMGVPVSAEALRAALTDVIWPGRLERFAWGDADVLLDAAHNPAGARALAAYLEEAGWSGAVLIFGAVQDKDVDAMLTELARVCRAVICTTAATPRAREAGALAVRARQLGSWTVGTEPDLALALARAVASGRQVVAAGSIFVIGPLRGILRR